MHTTTFDEPPVGVPDATAGRNYLYVGLQKPDRIGDGKRIGDAVCSVTVRVRESEIYKHNHASLTKGQDRHLQSLGWFSGRGIAR